MSNGLLPSGQERVGCGFGNTELGRGTSTVLRMAGGVLVGSLRVAKGRPLVVNK